MFMQMFHYLNSHCRGLMPKTSEWRKSRYTWQQAYDLRFDLGVYPPKCHHQHMFVSCKIWSGAPCALLKAALNRWPLDSWVTQFIWIRFPWSRNQMQRVPALVWSTFPIHNNLLITRRSSVSVRSKCYMHPQGICLESTSNSFCNPSLDQQRHCREKALVAFGSGTQWNSLY